MLPHWYDHWVRAVLALVVALALQIGVNYANDYSDGIRGIDKNRVGPPRLVGSGRAKPRTVLTVAIVFFGIAAVAGAILICAAASGGCSRSARSASRRPGSTPAASVRTATTRSARSSCSSSSASSRWPARCTPRPARSTSRPGSAASRSAPSPARCSSSTTCATASRTRSAASAPSPCCSATGGTRVLYVVLMLVPLGLLAFYAIFYRYAGFLFFVALAGAPGDPDRDLGEDRARVRHRACGSRCSRRSSTASGSPRPWRSGDGRDRRLGAGVRAGYCSPARCPRRLRRCRP